MRLAYALLAILCACGKSSDQPPAAKPPPVAAAYAFVDVTVVPMDSERELPHQTVLVDGTRIVAIGPAESMEVPPAAKVIPAKGKWLAPGLVDMHVHFNVELDGALYLANGVTTVRNMWGNGVHVQWRERAKQNDPTWLGPWVYTAGPIVDGSPPTWPGSAVVDTADAARAEVRAEKAFGYDFVKVYDGLPLAAYNAIAAEAKAQGMRFAGHVPAAVGLEHALASGQASIEHLTGYLMAAQDATSKAASLPREAQRAEVAAHLDETKLPALAKATAAANVANVPTLVVLSRFGALDHPEALLARPENQYVSPTMLAAWDPKQDFRLKTMGAADFDAMRVGNRFRAKLVKALVEAGAPVFVGTDTPNPFVVPGFAEHEELQLLVAAGLSSFQALRAATAAPAAWLDPAAHFGVVEVGARADLVLVDADPLVDLKTLAHPRGVMARGRWYSAEQLASQLAAVAAEYRAPAKKLDFADAPPLPVSPIAGPKPYLATYAISIGGQLAARERLAVQTAIDGSRVIVGQTVAQDQKSVQETRFQLDAHGRLTLAALTDNGAFTVRPDGDQWRLGQPHDKFTNFPGDADLLFDTNTVTAMIPFADRALRALAKGKPGDAIDVKGLLLASPVTLPLGAVTYRFVRPASGRIYALTATSTFGPATGTYEVDAQGFPTKIVVKSGMGELAVTRE